jgi:predicted ATPase/DNA-binding SARP family transcriptional activator
VRNDAGDLVPVAGARLRDLIARLALAGGRPVSTSALADAVWGGDPPADLANALQTLVSRARRALGGASAVEQSAAGYRLAVAPDDVDALRFERLAADGNAEAALKLWRGPAALDDVGDFAAPYARRLADLRLDASTGWLAHELEAGRAAAHVTELEALAVANPLNEKVIALLMRALADTGRQAEALAAYERLRGRLAEELGIDPGAELRAVHLEVLRGKVRGVPDGGDRFGGEGSGRGDRGRTRRRTNVRAQLTSFVGREDEVSRVGEALGIYRLVTLVGPGGAGKTRLATEIAAQFTAPDRIWPDGIWMAELASVTDAADVPQAVLGSVGLRESRLTLDGAQRVTSRDAQTRLLDGLADARALLVLDNCEHLIDACAHLADTLLAHSPGLRIVATSREPLGIVGESLLPVPPLETDPAVRLFADRAAAVSPGFALDTGTLPLVADIVRRLDGLPLAIELAAARLRTLPLAEISRRLDDRFRLLTGGSRTALPRHRTLRAVVEWSWDLLSPAERLLAERFSVFPAGATPEAAAAVCGGSGDMDDLLSSLVDKSLLRWSSGGTADARLRMLETIREYGAEKLAARAETGEVRRRHAEYYSDLMNEAAPRLLTRDQLLWLKMIEPERDNILAALHYWCDAPDAARAIALAVSVASLAFLLGSHADIPDLVGQAAALPGEADPDQRTVIDALYAIIVSVQAGSSAPDSGAPDSGARAPGAPGPGGSPAEPGDPGLSDRVDELAFDRYPLAGLLRPLYAMFTQDNEHAARYIEEARASHDEWLAAAAWIMSAGLAENNGDMDGFRAASARALDRFRALGERWGLASALRMTGSVRILDGDLDGAAAAFDEAGRVLREMGARDEESFMRLRLADIAARRGQAGAARDFFRGALAAAESDGESLDVALVSAAYAMFEVTMGSTELARPLHATAEQKAAQLGPGHPARHHMVAVAAASGLKIALADGNVPLAGERAATMYQEAIAADDMPLLASVGGTLAHLARALGQPARAAEMLGACAVVRGGEDPTDLAVTQLGSMLREDLGAEGYSRAYAAGKARGRAEARELLDPATL